MLTYRGQEIWEWSSGIDPSNGRKATADSVFRIGSVSKVFPALLGLLAESRGLISLDDPVREHVPELDMIDPFHEANSPRRNSFSWRQLASHTAGLPREAPCTYHSCQRTNEEMLQRLRTTRLILPAAAKPSYSNLGYALLGQLLGRVFQSDYTTLVHDAILSPLNMLNTSFEPPSRYVPPVPNMPLYDLGWLSPSGQLFSTARDLGKLAIALNLASSDPFLFGNPRWNPTLSHQTQNSIHPVSRPQLRFTHGSRANSSNPTGINQSLLRESMFPTYLNPDGTGYGMPWEFVPLGPYYIRNKGGNLQGYSANIALVPELQLGLTITTNLGTDASLWSTVNLAQFIPDFEKVLDPLQGIPSTPGHPEKYVGKYDPSTEISINSFGYLAITKLKGLTADIPLVPSSAEPNNPGVLQFYLPQAGLPCMSFEFSAIAYEYVEFKFDKSGVATSFTIPGLMYADSFTKAR